MVSTVGSREASTVLLWAGQRVVSTAQRVGCHRFVPMRKRMRQGRQSCGQEAVLLLLTWLGPTRLELTECGAVLVAQAVVESVAFLGSYAVGAVLGGVETRTEPGARLSHEQAWCPPPTCKWTLFYGYISSYGCYLLAACPVW